MADDKAGKDKVTAEERKRYEQRLKALKNERMSAGWDQHYKEISEWTNPLRGRFNPNQRNKGDKRNQKIINETIIIARRALVSGLMAGVTSPARPWLRFAAENRRLNSSPAVQMWLSEAQQSVLSVFRRSNLYQALPRLYEEEVDFGTSAMCVMEDPETLCRFYNYAPGSFWLAQSYRGVIDTFYREFQMTARNMEQQFGLEVLSAATKDLLRTNPDAWVTVVHLVEPNDSRVIGRVDNQNMLFRSVWYEVGQNCTGILKKSGFREFPIVVLRWAFNEDDIYARGPVMEALGANKQLQHEERRKGELIDKMTRPALQAPSQLQDRRVSQIPGEVTFYDSVSGDTKIEPLFMPHPSGIQALREDIREIEARINDILYKDLFLMISELDRAQITATEIDERRQEKLLMLGPVLEQLESSLDGMIDRVFNMMVRESEPYWAGMKPGEPPLPPPPPELADVNLKVEYISILAQAQRSIGIEAMDAYVKAGLALASEGAMDKVDVYEYMDMLGEMRGVSPKIIIASEDAAASKQAREQRAAQMQQSAMMPGIAKAAKDLGGASTEEGNVLGDVMRQVSGL
jgi:hypothetical protein